LPPTAGSLAVGGMKPEETNTALNQAASNYLKLLTSLSLQQGPSQI
jgi:hypothetical protein